MHGMPRASASLVLLLALGCARSTEAPLIPPAPPPEAPLAIDDPLEPSGVRPPRPRPGPCATGGRLWDGKPVDCSYEHGGCCYGSAASACAAAGCGDERCQVLESYPAQIHCAPDA